MKKFATRIAVASTLALSLLVSNLGPAVPAYAQEFESYTSGVQVQNLENAAATVTLTAYNPDGTVNATITPPDTPKTPGGKLQPLGDYTAFPLGVQDGFQGSMVVSSDKRVAAIANVLSADFRAGASYLAASEGAPVVQLPLLMKDNAGFTTWYAIQNTGTTDATVSVAYSDGTTAGPYTIKPNAAQVVYQKNETHPAKVFSAIITSGDGSDSAPPIVAAAIEESSTVMFAYTGFTGGATFPVFPLINANNVGYVTGVQIQNTGNQATEVVVTYTPSGGPNDGVQCIETKTLAAKGTDTFALAAFAPGESAGENSTCADGQRFVGSAKVTGNSTDQPLVAIVNQLSAINGEAYGSFDPAAATATVVMPLIMDRNSGFYTGFNVQNVGTQDTTVNCKFTGGVSYTVGRLLKPGEALNDIQNTKIQDKYVGAGTCTATGGDAKIVGVVNELGVAFDQLLVYEGANN